MATRRARERVMDYLYGGMSEVQALDFESEVERNPELSRLLREERAFDRLVGREPSANVSDDLVEHSRQALEGALRRRRQGAGSWFRRALEGQLGLRGLALPTMAAALLLLGFAVGRTRLPGMATLETASALAPSIASLIGSSDVEVIDVGVDRFDSGTGEVRLSFDVAASVSLTANVRNPSIQELLLGVFKGSVESSGRLEAVDLLDQAGSDETAQAALILALRTDPNPGVRLRAAEALSPLAENEEVRNALRIALVKDVNPGVRVQAFEAIEGFSDDATVAALVNRASNDPNQYIRRESKRLLSEKRRQDAASNLKGEAG